MRAAYLLDAARWLRAALGLARRGEGQCWPNPSVGCVLVQQGQAGAFCIAQGHTAAGGRPHAETEALKNIPPHIRKEPGALQNITLYVTLEPCAHHGKTPPCTDAIIAAGIERVVVGMLDPDKRVSGAGIKRLQEAGIETMLLELPEIEDFYSGYRQSRGKQRPAVSVKIASSLDGASALSNGESQWITNQQARNYGHLLRARHDAILIGAGTLRQDNPALTCRLAGMEDTSPLPVIIGGKQPLPSSCKIFEAGQKFILALPKGQKIPSLPATAQLLQLESKSKGEIDLSSLLHELGQIGLTRVLVEGGPRLIASFLQAGLVDDLYWFKAPLLLGGDAQASIGGLSLDKLVKAPKLILQKRIMLGRDSCEQYKIA